MAIIRPATDNTVELRPGTGARLQAAEFDGGQAIGRAVSRLGQEGADFAQARHEIELRDAETAARDADNQAQQQKLDLYYNGEGAFFNLRGRDALTAQPDIVKRRDQIDQEVAGKLKSPWAQQMYKDIAARRRNADDEQIARHTAQERVRYEDQVFEQGMSVAISGAVGASDNPAEIERNFATIDSMVEQRAQRRGLAQAGTPEMDMLKKRALSGAVGAVAERLRLRSPGEAQAFIMAQSERIDPVELTKLLGAIDEEAAAEQADGMVDNFIVYTSVEQQVADPSLGEGANAGPATPTAVPPMAVQVAAIAGQESGNRERDANGRLITSSAGAQGKMQVMPGTNRDPGYGVKPARDNSDAERTRVGNDYYKAMLKEYGGNMALALAAYNAGPGNVDKWIKQYGDPRTGNISDSAWINKIPVEETRKYVPSVLKRMGVVPGKAGVAASPEAQSATYAGEEINLQATINKIDASEELTYPEKQALKASARERYSLGRQSRADAEARVKDAAYEEMTRLGDNFTDYNQLPLNVRQQAEAIPELKARLMGSAQANREARARAAEAAQEDARRSREENYEIDMIALQQDNPDAFAQRDFMGENISFELKRRLMTRQGEIRRRGESNLPNFSYGRTRAVVGRYAGPSSGISNSRRMSEDDRANRTLLEDRVNKRAEQWIRDNKKQIPDSELDAIVREELTPVVVVKPGRLWGTNEETVPAYQTKSMEPGTQMRLIIPQGIPAEEARRIARDYAAENQGAIPDPEKIRRIYRAVHP